MNVSAVPNTSVLPKTGNVSIFDAPIDRKTSNSMKWSWATKFLPPGSAVNDALPMWAADLAE